MENIPKETETIAARRSARLAEKFKNAGVNFGSRRAWWSNGPLETLILVFAFAVNFYLVYPFFGTAALSTQYSGPIIPLLASIINLSGISTAYAIQIVYIAFILIFPLSYYVFIKKISGRKLVALFALMIVSLPIVPFLKTRIEMALTGIEGPHVASLTLMPLAIYGLLAFLHSGGIKNMIIATISAALVGLTSPFGFVTYSIFASITTFSEVLLGTGRLKSTRFIAVIILVVGLSSFWYNPAFFVWLVTGPLGEQVANTISNLIPISIFSLPVLGIFGYLLFDRKPNLQPLFLAFFFTIAFTMIIFAGTGFVFSHPSRYLTELGISLALLVSIAIVGISDKVKFMKARGGLIKGEVLGNIIIVSSFLLLFLCNVIGRESLLEQNVLGVWDEIDKGEIWVAKESFGIGWTYLGYSITCASLIGITFMGLKADVGGRKKSNEAAKV